MDIKQCTALVTGGNRGIGEAFVKVLLEQGAKKVYIGARTKTDAEPLQQSNADRLDIVQLDVTRQIDIDAAVEQCKDVNLLINNAGVFAHQSLLNAPDMDAMRQEMDVNCFGMIAMTRAFTPIIESLGEGAVINVLSAGGIVSVPEMGGYSPSKFAARAASNCLRAELAPRNIHVCSLIVGSVKTRMAEHVKGILQADPIDIAKAGLMALSQGLDEHDTDPHAIGIRAALARDPAALAARLAAGVGAFRK
ncbi:MAG: SDR family NAD(P)-dependent oxidoreductase [Woeseiaceae bacterium]